MKAWRSSPVCNANEFFASCGYPYLLPLLVLVEVIGLEIRGACLDASSHRVAEARNLWNVFENGSEWRRLQEA
jgi:hypothetical protein